MLKAPAIMAPYLQAHYMTRNGERLPVYLQMGLTNSLLALNAGEMSRKPSSAKSGPSQLLYIPS